MFSLIYKTILISIISSMLMVGEITAYADTTGQVTGTTDGSNSYQKTNKYDLGEAKDDDAVNIIAMLAIGVLAIQMLQYQKWSYDMMAAAAAGGAYIVGEIMNIMNTKNELEKLSVSVTLREDGKIDSKQVEYIKKLRESYEKVKTALERKKILLQMALAGFGIAAGIAIYQKIIQTSSYTACTGAIAEGIAACSVAALSPTESVGCGTCIAAANTLLLAVNELEINTNLPKPTVVAATENAVPATTAKAVIATPCAGATAIAAKATISTGCTTYLLHHQLTAAAGVFAPVGNLNFNDYLNGVDKNISLVFASKIASQEIRQSLPKPSFTHAQLRKILNAFIPTAHAGYAAMLGLTGGAIAMYFTLKSAVGRAVDMMLASPGLRIVTWGVMSGMTMLAIGSTTKKIEVIDGNIKKIDNILNETAKLKKGVHAAAAINQNVNIVANPEYVGDVTLSKDPTIKTTCLAGANSTDPSACNSLAAVGTNLSAIQDMPDGLSSLTNQLTKAADGLSGKNSISGTTMGQANNIGKKANAILKSNKEQLKVLNDILKKQGKGVTDFDAEEAKFKKGLFGNVADALKSKGMTPNGFLASIGMGPIGDSNATKGKLDESSSGKSKKPTGKSPDVGGAPNLNAKVSDIKITDDAPMEAGGVLANGMREGSINDKYDIKENDINGDSKTSIFEVISNRYKRSAYPKLLEEDLQVKK